jgi:hypothetical protein
VVPFFAWTEDIPETVNVLDGESIEREPAVVTLTPVKSFTLFTVMAIGVTASVTCNV